MANTRRMNRLEELGRVDSEKAFTKKGKKNLKEEKSRIVGELKKGGPANAKARKVAKSRKSSGRINIDDIKRAKKSSKTASGSFLTPTPKLPIPPKRKKVEEYIDKFRKSGMGRDKKKKGINRYDEYLRRKDPYKSKPKKPKVLNARGGGIAKRGMGKAK